MPRKSDWAKRFGASRQAKDKAYCEAAERAIEAEVNRFTAVRELEELQNERRRELERLTGIGIRTI